MGYRDTWLNHEGNLTCHSEVVLHALDRALPDNPLRVLVIGVENGGSMQVWEKCLPQGSIVVGIDIDTRCADLGLNVITVDVTDRAAVKQALRGHRYDLIVDDIGAMAGYLWPYLTPAGVLIVNRYDIDKMLPLVAAVSTDAESWLPVEEIMCVTWFPQIAVIEKRDPRVVPYLNIMVGTHSPVVPEETYAHRRSAKRITLRPTDTPDET